MTMSPRSLALALPLGLALLTPAASAQRTAAERASREAMWPAPSAQDWKRPCLITWQRTFEDALEVSRETGKAILVCVNMDGEIASEHYAGIRYRQPEITALYEPYVAVIASVYRHNPRDFDEQGRRIICPRFGTVTCGEHIAIEPGLFEQFFEGQRVAPRHIGVEIDSAEMYDVYYAFDTDTIFDTLREGIANRDVSTTDIRHDRPILERVASRDSLDRAAVETAYVEGDRELRHSLLQAAQANAYVAQVDLLRLAVYDLDEELRQMAWRTLAQSTPEPAVDLIAQALEAPLEAEDRDAFIAALEQIGESSPRARRLALVHRGLAVRSNRIDVESWTAALQEDQAAQPAGDDVVPDSHIASLAEAAEARPDYAVARLELAQAILAEAMHTERAPKFARLLFEDARRTALEAQELGATGWRVDSVLALAAQDLGDWQEAQAWALAAVGDMPPEARDEVAAAVLAIFADARRRAILRAVREQREWPGEWLTEVHAAYNVLVRHPIGTDSQVRAHYDFLRMLGARGHAERILEEGLLRFPDSWVLHDRLRGRTLEGRGLDGFGGLEAVYEAMLREPDAPQNLEWFAGYASLVAAEFHRRANRDDQALAAYERAIAHYERAMQANPDGGETSDHYIALAHAGRARLAFESGDYERAVAELLASFERRPAAAASLDGLGISAVATARMLRARLSDQHRDDLAAQIGSALDGLDPDLLRLPAFERMGPDGIPRGRRPRRDR